MRRLGLPPRLAFQINAAGPFRRPLSRRRRPPARGGRRGAWRSRRTTGITWPPASDGRVLRLYVDALDGRGYQLRAARTCRQRAPRRLGKGGDDCVWSIGRGIVAGHAGEFFQGLIDEVRVSDVALAPAEFLFAKK